MKPVEVNLPEGYVLVGRSTRKRILSALGYAQMAAAAALNSRANLIMQELREELWREAFSTKQPPEQMALSPEEFDAATLALIIQAGSSFIPLVDMPTYGHAMRRGAVAGLLDLHPLRIVEDQRYWKLEDLECIRYQLRDLGIDEVQAKS